MKLDMYHLEIADIIFIPHNFRTITNGMHALFNSKPYAECLVYIGDGQVYSLRSKMVRRSVNKYLIYEDIAVGLRYTNLSYYYRKRLRSSLIIETPQKKEMPHVDLLNRAMLQVGLQGVLTDTIIKGLLNRTLQSKDLPENLIAL